MLIRNEPISYVVKIKTYCNYCDKPMHKGMSCVKIPMAHHNVFYHNECIPDLIQSLIKASELTNNPLLNSIAELQADSCFVESYKNDRNLEERKLEGLGIAIAQYTKWDGIRILEIAMAALEDANFHTEANKLEEMIYSLKGEKDEEEIVL